MQRLEKQKKLYKSQKSKRKRKEEKEQKYKKERVTVKDSNVMDNSIRFHTADYDDGYGKKEREKKNKNIRRRQ